jgi:hypothetical protein
MRVSARLHATAAPDAPAPMINTSTVCSDMGAPFLDVGAHLNDCKTMEGVDDKRVIADST